MINIITLCTIYNTRVLYYDRTIPNILRFHSLSTSTCRLCSSDLVWTTIVSAGEIPCEQYRPCRRRRIKGKYYRDSIPNKWASFSYLHRKPSVILLFMWCVRIANTTSEIMWNGYGRDGHLLYKTSADVRDRRRPRNEWNHRTRRRLWTGHRACTRRRLSRYYVDGEPSAAPSRRDTGTIAARIPAVSSDGRRRCLLCPIGKKRCSKRILRFLCWSLLPQTRAAENMFCA